MKFFDIENIAFTLGGTGVSFLELIGVIAGLTCVVMAGRNSKYNFWVGYLYNILLFTLFWQRHLYSAMLLQPIAFGINAFGHWRWTHPRPEEQSSKDASALKVTHLSMRDWCTALTVVAFAGAAWGFVLSKLGTVWFTDIFTPDPTPWLDSYGLMLTLLEEVGLLDRVACGEHHEHHPLPQRRPRVHADRQRPVSAQRHLVPVDLVPAVQRGEVDPLPQRPGRLINR